MPFHQIINNSEHKCHTIKIIHCIHCDTQTRNSAIMPPELLIIITIGMINNQPHKITGIIIRENIETWCQVSRQH
ncbi:MAG: hypothetical protein KAG53_04770 [Endozoicomonadaceae bacterium]|nr:hypothetical protein [Endozoicomonadaceae bacterium]